MRTHTGEKTNKCNFCHKRFCWKGNLIESFVRKDFLGMESWLNTSAHIMKKRNSNVNFVRTDFLEMETSINTYSVSPHCECYTQCVAFNMWHAIWMANDCVKKYVRRFSWNVNLINRVCTYTGEKTNKCNFCHKRFCWKGNIIEHNYMHFEEKSLKCKLCEKRFSLNGKLIEHKCTHYEEKKFKCKFGEKWFCRNGNFN